MRARHLICLVGFSSYCSATLFTRDAVSDSLRAGLQSLSHPSVNDPRSTLNAVIEQYIGILPPVTLTAIQTALQPVLAFPVKDDLFKQAINNALLSITASASGNTVTAIEQLEDCLYASLSTKKAVISCYSTPGGPLSTLETALDGVIEQGAGYLPPNIVLSLLNNIGYALSTSPGTAIFYDFVSNVINSIVASTSGNSVTALEQMQQCVTNVVQLGKDLPDSYLCFTDGPLTSLQIILNGIIQQAFGYLPPNLVLDLQTVMLPANLQDEEAYKAALQAVFQASGAGPRFVDCLEALETCLVVTLQTRQAQQCQALSDACRLL